MNQTHSRPFRSSHPRFDAVICDVDGCLTPESSTPLDLSALAQIAQHNARALTHRDIPLLTLCTGRPQPFAECISRMIGNAGPGALPLIAENGVWMYDPSCNEYQMDPAISRADRDAIREAAKWLEEEYGPQGVTQQPGKAASVSLYHAEPALLRSILPRLEQEFQARGWPMRVSMTWFYINCDLVHISKATGLVRLLARTGLERSRLLGIGDTMSDMAIRAHVGTFACPANAAEGLKPHADMVAKSSEARGVVEILEMISPF